jgi:hypothetical protein
MAHDFAKHRNNALSTKRKPARAATRTGTATQNNYWSWYFCGLFSGVIMAFVVYMGALRLQEDGTPESQTVQGNERIIDLPVFDFGFYNNLATTEITVDGPANNATAPRTPVTSTEAETEPANYLLQAGSFQSRQDAESRRAVIILLNMNASIVPGVVSGRTWYRVQVGPYSGHRNAEVARDGLSENNIDSIPLLIR